MESEGGGDEVWVGDRNMATGIHLKEKKVVMVVVAT